MKFSDLCSEAEKTVSTTRRKLPMALRAKAETVPVLYHDWPSAEIVGEALDPEMLGLFVGEPHGESGEGGGAMPAQIHLFLENIWDYADAELAIFREEVRITYLHELGHYLGLDEDELEMRGLE